jgi:hypothetical protein
LHELTHGLPGGGLAGHIEGKRVSFILTAYGLHVYFGRVHGHLYIHGVYPPWLPLDAYFEDLERDIKLGQCFLELHRFNLDSVDVSCGDCIILTFADEMA